jgi:hypothetical protein
MNSTIFPSPLGALTLIGGADGLSELHFRGRGSRVPASG